MNAPLATVFDALLLLSLTGLAWASLASPDARRSIILFMTFGLIMAVAWARLLAPDVALAEAAIGAGLSGALLLAALQRRSRDPRPAQPARAAGPLLHAAVTLLCLALAASLAWALLHALDQPGRDTTAAAVAAHLGDSGVSNPVTAVLLNFRAYDTLLELAVLLTAVLGMFALGRATPGYLPAGPVFEGLAQWLAPVLIVFAGYLLWAGAHAPGGAFQAGATLAAAAVVLRLAGRQRFGLPAGDLLRLVLAAGVGVFLLVGLALLLGGREFLDYPPDWAGTLILLIETAAMLSIAATLALAFAGGRPPAARAVREPREGPEC